MGDVEHSANSANRELVVEHNGFTLHTYTIEATDGLHWVAEYEELPGVLGTHVNMQKAIEDLKYNSKVHLEVIGELEDEGFLPRIYCDLDAKINE